MFSILNHVGFNITKNKLQLVEVVKESSKYCLENVDEHIFEEELDFNLEESNIINILQTSLNSLKDRTQFKSKNISFSLPLSEFEIFQIPFEPSLSKSALEEHVKWEFSILFPMLNVNNYIIRTLKLETIENENIILVVGLLKRTVSILLNFASNNNFKLKFIDTSHLSSDSLFPLLENKKTLSIYIAENVCSINSYIGKGLHSTKQFELSNIDFLVDVINGFIENQNIAYNNIYITSTKDVDQYSIDLETKLHIPIEIINPFKLIEISDSFIQNAHYLNKPNMFSSAAGICYRKI